MALPPGPRLPRSVQLAHWVLRPQEYLEDCARRWGECFTIRLMRNPTTVLVTDPPTIKRIFTGNPSVLFAGEAATILEPLVGVHSLLLLDGARHLRERRLMLPPFHGARMKAYAEEMRLSTEREVATWQEGESLCLLDRFQAITLDIILRTVFGIENADQMEELREELHATMRYANTAPALLPFLPGGTKARAAFDAQLGRADQLIYAEIGRRRDAGATGHDVMSMLMQARDEDGNALGDQELRDQLITLLVAGHETTASALTWTIESLLGRRSTLERLQQEIGTVLGDAPITDSTLPRLPYLEATIYESLRLRPIIPIVARRLQVPMEVHGYQIPAGVAVGLGIYLTQRRPDIYEDPELFKPERFLGKKPDPYEWLPFGGGVRRCLGQAFALYEMKVVLATVLQKYSFDLAWGSSSRMARRAITFVPSSSGEVKVLPRPTA